MFATRQMRGQRENSRKRKLITQLLYPCITWVYLLVSGYYPTIIACVLLFNTRYLAILVLMLRRLFARKMLVIIDVKEEQQKLVI